MIGSGATAITLVPAMADIAAHVTMLQRSPTYVVSKPNKDYLAEAMRVARVPAGAIYKLGRARNIALQRALSKSQPTTARQVLLAWVRANLGPAVDMQHFRPSYKPWDQRVCVVPDADLFKALKSDRAELVTDRIETFTETGIRLESGRELPADIS